MQKAAIFGALLLFLYAGFRPPEGISKVPLADISFEKKFQETQKSQLPLNANEPEESLQGK